MKNGIGVYRRRVVDEQLVSVPNRYTPVIRKRVGYAIYYRWTWWAIFDVKLKTVWRKGYTDINAWVYSPSAWEVK